MATREIIRIDEELCDGCGDCVPSCAEGAIAIVDGKARLVSEVYCDGMGACLGHCPRGAISMEEVEAAAFDPAAVERHLAAQRPPTSTPRPVLPSASPIHQLSACPGSQTRAWSAPVAAAAGAIDAPTPSALRQWPIQLHLLAPTAPYLNGAELLLAADCVPFAVGDFHARFLAGRKLAIACPKLDSEQQRYLDKLVSMIDHGGVAGLTVVVMEVPCCSGLVRLALEAASRATRRVPVRRVVVSVTGETLSDDSIAA
jgi:Pyruvate/2-oxoacid:ferredoxin oxidoreductase delta subunit